MRLRSARGVTLVELMVASVILTTLVLAGIGSFRFITEAIRRSRTKTIANNIIAERMEVLKNYNYFQLLVTTDTATNANYTPNLVYDNGAYAPETITLWGYPPFTRAVRVDYAQNSGTSVSTISYTSNDTGLKMLTVYVLWKDKETYKKIEIRNLLANPAASSLDSGISGTVTKTGGAALPGAQIGVIGSPNWKGSSDASGDYGFQVSRGTYSVTCSSAGYYSQTKTNVVASRGFYTDVDFTMVAIGSGTVAGTVWLSTSLVISQVAASTGTNVEGNEVEFVELYNPTTYVWIMNASNFSLWYREKNSGAAMAEIPLTYTTAVLSPNSFFLIASTSPVAVAGSTVAPDATYTNCPATCDVIKDNSDGGVGIRKNSSSMWWDRVAWAKGGGPDPPADLTEGAFLLPASGLQDGQKFARYSSTAGVSSTLGNAYDTDVNFYNFSLIDPMTLAPRRSTNALKAVAGHPLPGALVFVSDGLSAPAQAQRLNAGTANEYAHFSVPGVATGTWSVTFASGSYKLDVTTVVVTQGATTYIPNSVTGASWPVAGYFSAFLTSQTAGGFVQGYVYGAGPSYNSPLSGILVDVNGTATRTSSNGYYFVNVATGTVTVTANNNSDNSNYATDFSVGTVTEGVASYIPASPYFHLGQAGVITGYVTSGTGALPNIVVKAQSGAQVYESPSDATGRFYITASTSGTSYTVTASLDPVQTFTTAPDPLTASVTTPGSTVFCGTITVTGGMGYITGSVTESSKTITTGVLVVASLGAVADPPPLIYGSSAPALTNPYYAASSQADGSYRLELRAGTYNMRAYYPVVNTTGGTVSYTTKTKSSVAVTAGATTSGQSFTWP